MPHQNNLPRILTPNHLNDAHIVAVTIDISSFETPQVFYTLDIKHGAGDLIRVNATDVTVDTHMYELLEEVLNNELPYGRNV